MANSLLLLAHAAAEAAGEHHAEPIALGLTPAAWVALSMAVLFGIAIYLKVPAMLTSGLDKSIAEIRKQLDEAKALRAEAEALRKEYADKIANAEKDAAAMLEHARHEAEAIVAKAEADTTAMIGRREKMAEDKIAAAERGAIADLQAKAADAAATAARGIIAAKHTAKADKSLVDQAIAGI
jgi:F-type H+-transporting ATPase subunit b